jgi:hypothetical protein
MIVNLMTVVCTCWLKLYVQAYTDACKTHYTIPVYTAVFLKMNPRFRNIEDIKKLKFKILI